MHHILLLGSIFLVVHARFPCCTSNKIDSSKYLANHQDIKYDETTTLQERIGRRKRRRLEQELNNTKINYSQEKWEEKRSRTFKNSPMNQFNITDGVWQSQIGRVIGGTRVPLGRYNYMAQGIGNLACGGVLIAPNIVLTAAHCRGGYRQAIVGIYDWDTLDDPTVSNAEIISVAHEIPHPLFDKDTYFADVMIVVLDRLSVFEPVCLANENTLSNLDIFLNVLGFGVNEMNGPLASTMSQASVKYINNPLCESKYGSKSIFDGMMCADSSNEGRDACQGDSGGPLIKQGDAPGDDIAVGIVSWGIGCGELPGVYTRISSYVDWIVSKVDEYGGQIPSRCKKKGTLSTSENSDTLSKSGNSDTFTLPKSNLLSLGCEVTDNKEFRYANKSCAWIKNNSKSYYCKKIKVQANCPNACACFLQQLPTWNSQQDTLISDDYYFEDDALELDIRGCRDKQNW